MKRIAKKIILGTFALFISFICFLVSAFADVIYLKNGQEIEGKIIAEANGYVKVRVKIGEVKINEDNIKSIEKKRLPEGFFVEEQEAVSETTRVESAPKQEKHLKKIIYKIDVKAKFSKQSENGIVSINGKTNFPDGALIYIFLKRQSIYMALKEVPVKDGKFSIIFGSFKKRFSFGRYMVEADFIPDRQTANISNKLGSKNMQLVEGVCYLTVGSEEEIKKFQKNTILSLNAIITELSGLYRNLNNEYRTNLEALDVNNWDKWSKNWLDQLEGIKEKNKLRNREYAVSLYPRIEDIIKSAIYYLSYLQYIYSMRIKQPDRYSAIYNKSDVLVSPQYLNNMITRGLLRVKNTLDTENARKNSLDKNSLQE